VLSAQGEKGQDCQELTDSVESAQSQPLPLRQELIDSISRA
jgi:hypothetical protein